MTIEQVKAIVEAYYNASQKQIEIFEKAFPSQKSSARSDKEPFEIAIEALEKQIPKKPYKTKEPISQKQNDYYCSVCKRYLGDDMELKHACLQPEYCQHCGQALDWSDTE